MEENTVMHERQADFFAKLRETRDFRHGDLIRYADMGESTATRKIRGITELTISEARQLIARHPDVHVRCDVAEYLVQATGVMVQALPELPVGGGCTVGEDTARAFEGMAQFIRERAEHMADGRLEPHERARQEDLVRGAGRELQLLLLAVASQKTMARQKAKPFPTPTMSIRPGGAS